MNGRRTKEIEWRLEEKEKGVMAEGGRLNANVNERTLGSWSDE